MKDISREGTRNHASGVWFVLVCVAWLYRMGVSGNPEGILAVLTLALLGFWAGTRGLE